MIKENKEMGDDLRRAIRERISVKKPRVREGVEIGKFATSSIDMSDGFAVSLYEISDKSGVGFVVEFDEIPVDPLVSDNDLDDLLYGGGDYGLLFTMREDKMGNIEEIEEKEISVVGRATERREILLRQDGIERVIERRGYDHMVKR
jgi:thiamine-monophosphate kinase